MALRMFTPGTGWEEARRDLRFTMSSLTADEAHHEHAAPLEGLIGQWNAIDTERRDGDDALVDANALIAAIDERLDAAIEKLATRVRYELGGGPRAEQHPTFRTFFPSPPYTVIALGLGSKLERTARFQRVVEEVGASKEVRAIVKSIATIGEQGGEALAERSRADDQVARVALRIAAWKESANTARRTVDTLLDGHANSNRLPRSYAASFFPRRPRSAAKKPTPANGVSLPASSNA